MAFSRTKIFMYTMDSKALNCSSKNKIQLLGWYYRFYVLQILNLHLTLSISVLEWFLQLRFNYREPWHESCRKKHLTNDMTNSNHLTTLPQYEQLQIKSWLVNNFTKFYVISSLRWKWRCCKWNPNLDKKEWRKMGHHLNHFQILQTLTHK